MTPMVQSQFTRELLQLLKETFEGPETIGPSAFLNKGTGLFQTVDGISDEVASAPARLEGSTIAAHTEHIRFYVAVHYKLMLGDRGNIDWDQSWRIRTVTSAEWRNLRRDLHKAFATVNDHLTALKSWDEDEVSVAMSIVAHTAYHLGAIRQILLTVQPSASNQF